MAGAGAGAPREVRKESLNAPFNRLQATAGSPSEETARFALHPPHAAYPTPYIEHWVLQLHGVCSDRIDDPDLLNATLDQAVAELELTRVSTHSHYFGPGVSTVIILSESHLSAHTWPELGYLHVDIVTCVRKLTEEKLRTVLGRAFRPEHLQLAQIQY
jgi:S-adenosylmethionine decarboxylase